MYFPLFVRVLRLHLFIMHYFKEEEKAGCFAFIVIQMYCYYKCYVALPHGAVGWSAVCDCCITCSYSLTFCHSDCLFSQAILLAFWSCLNNSCLKYMCTRFIIKPQAQSPPTPPPSTRTSPTQSEYCACTN